MSKKVKKKQQKTQNQFLKIFPFFKYDLKLTLYCQSSIQLPLVKETQHLAISQTKNFPFHTRSVEHAFCWYELVVDSLHLQELKTHNIIDLSF